MQIQADHILHPETVRILSESAVVFNWTGDVREDLSMYKRIGHNCITTFTNTTDVELMRAAGFRSEYLQTGYDTVHYNYKPSDIKHRNIVFCANHYENSFPLSRFRVELVRTLKIHFGDTFNLYGGGWEKEGLCAEIKGVDNAYEAELYRTCAIAINCSHFAYGRYSSDRLFREMACGAFVLTHRFPDLETDFSNGRDLVVFESLQDLVEKCNYYLDKPEIREPIGKYAANKAKTWFTWDNFVDNLLFLYNKHKKQ